jgi:CRISPR-associated protein Csx14
MAEHAIPVDLYNPGQVFACLGFLEAADALLGDAEGGFEWNEADNVQFRVSALGNENPFEAVLAFLARSEVRALAPTGWRPKEKPGKEPKNDKDRKKQENARIKLENELAELVRTEFIPSRVPETMAALSVQIRSICAGHEQKVMLSHWADSETGRDNFKLYAGNRSSLSISTAMIVGTRAAPKKDQNIGDLETKGVMQLWEEEPRRLIKEPFDVLTPMGGSFNFDPRGAWTAIEAGYSPNDQGDQVAASPVVELLAAWGLEHARPLVSDGRQIRYAVWGTPLPPCLARVALIGAIPSLPMQRFRFLLDSSGKNKIVTFAERETQP